MLPNFTPNNRVYRWTAHAISSSESWCAASNFSKLVQLAYLNYLFIRKFVGMIVYPAFCVWLNGARKALAFCLSLFFYLVGNIVVVGSNKQVVRKNTFSPVTMMKALQALWNRTNKKLVGDLMSATISAFQFELSVAISKFTSCPSPARTALINVGQESFDCGHNKKNTHRTQREGPHSDAALNPMGVKLVSLFRSPFKAFRDYPTFNQGGQVANMY